jgi:hypothetical protein
MLHRAVDKNRSFQMAGHAAYIDMRRNECRDMGEPEGKVQLGRPTNKKENNIK